MSVIAAKAVGAAVQAVTAAVEANLKSSGWGRYSLNFQTSKLKTNSHKIKLLKLSAFLAVQDATQNSKKKLKGVPALRLWSQQKSAGKKAMT